MLSHSHPQACKPARVGVLGGGGFITGAIRCRLDANGKEIVLFGEGEGWRNQADVAEPGRLIAVYCNAGITNAVSGRVVSFRELADFAAASFPPCVAVRGTLRSGPMPHDGY